MPSPNPDDSLLLIRCPSCGQRFKVEETLKDRTVECGGCEHRFKIDEDVIVRGKRFYPGERQDSELNRFQRVPMAGGDAHIGVQAMRYGNVPDPAVLEPMSPQRIIAGGVGVAGMVFMGLLLMLGGGGLLDGMEVPNRVIMAVFAACLGIALLVYANPKARIKALAVGLLFATALISIPFFFKAGSQPPTETVKSGGAVESVPVEEPVSAEEKGMEDLKQQIGTDPLEALNAKTPTGDGSRRAIGLWLRGLDLNHRFLIRDYIVRVTGSAEIPLFYARDRNDYLMVVPGITQSYQEFADLCTPLGKVENIYPELSVVEVAVANVNFVEGNIEKLSNKGDPAFYDLNKRELESVDLARVKRAVQRLGEAEPKIYRVDITKKLIELLGSSAVDFKGMVSNALIVWSEEPGPAGEAAVAEIEKLVTAGKDVPRELGILAVREKNPKVVPFLDQLWLKNPSAWESIYADFGPGAEDTVLRRFPELKGVVRFSGVRLLGRVGGPDSLPVLAGLANQADPELRVLAEQATRSIRARSGQ